MKYTRAQARKFRREELKIIGLYKYGRFEVRQLIIAHFSSISDNFHTISRKVKRNVLKVPDGKQYQMNYP